MWGGWCTIPSAATAEIVGRAGYDWVGIDYQHGAMSLAGVDAMLAAIAISRIPAFVRVPSAGAGSDICRVLDYGARGVIVPVVNTPEEAESAALACRYEPRGVRSWAGPAVRAAMADPAYTPASANQRVKCIVMIETLRGTEAAAEILSVPGVDGVFVGPSDLAHSGGLPPSLFAADAAHVDRVLHVFACAQASNVVAGIYAGTVEAARGWYASGARFMALTDDTMMLHISATRNVLEARSAEDALG